MLSGIIRFTTWSLRTPKFAKLYLLHLYQYILILFPNLKDSHQILKSPLLILPYAKHHPSPKTKVIPSTFINVPPPTTSQLKVNQIHFFRVDRVLLENIEIIKKTKRILTKDWSAKAPDIKTMIIPLRFMLSLEVGLIVRDGFYLINKARKTHLGTIRRANLPIDKINW